MERLERFYRIDRLLKEKKLVSCAAFQKALGVSRATLKRDLEYMRSRFHAPIEYEREANGYRFGKPGAGPSYELPELWFNPAEIHALLTMLRLLGNLQPGLLEPQVGPLLERLRGILGRGDRSWREVEKRVRILQPGRREAKAAHFGVVAAALLKRSRLRIRHWNRIEDRETEREVSPQRLVHYRDNWYLDAYCHLRQDLRSFALDAIRDAVPLQTRAKEMPKAELDEYLKAGYGSFAGRKVQWATLQWATLKFAPRAARWVSTQSWHSRQRARIDPDGSFVLEIPYADERELVMEVLRYGAEVEVLGPDSLRYKVAEAHAEALELYREHAWP